MMDRLVNPFEPHTGLRAGELPAISLMISSTQAH
jgi:hypothetical protein